MLNKKKDIVTVDDISIVVKAFYEKAMTDDLIGTFFTEVVQLDFDIHLPKIISFWSSLLLDTEDYKGNPMLKHIELNKKKTLNKAHFERWTALWSSTIDASYSGPKATLAKEKAVQIGMLIQFKINRADSLLNSN